MRKERDKVFKTKSSVFLPPKLRSDIVLLLLYPIHWKQVESPCQ